MGGPLRPAKAQAIGVNVFAVRRVSSSWEEREPRTAEFAPIRGSQGVSLSLNLIRLVRWNAAGRWSGGPRLTSVARRCWSHSLKTPGKLPRGPSEQPGRRRWRKSRRKFPGLIAATPVQPHAASTNLAFDAPWGPARLAVRSKYRDSPPNAPCRNRSSHLPRRLRRTQTFP